MNKTLIPLATVFFALTLSAGAQMSHRDQEAAAERAINTSTVEYQEVEHEATVAQHVAEAVAHAALEADRKLTERDLEGGQLSRTECALRDCPATKNTGIVIRCHPVKQDEQADEALSLKIELPEDCLHGPCVCEPADEDDEHRIKGVE